MKRSAQVALVLMGVSATTATAAYMMPARDCPPRQAAPAPATSGSPATNLPPGVTPKQPSQRCGYRSSYHSWGNWGWNSYGRSTSTPAGSMSTALTNSGGRVGAVSSTSSSSSSSATRGGFGATGHAVSGGS